MIDEIKNNILKLQAVRKETDSITDDNMIWDIAARVAISKSIQQDKQPRKPYAQPAIYSKPQKNEEPASDKQMGLLVKLGIPIEPGLTKKTANALISKRLKGDGHETT